MWRVAAATWDSHDPVGMGAPAGQSMDHAVWQGVDRLIDRAPTLSDLRSHRLQLLAARRLRVLGKDVPRDFVSEEQAAAAVSLAVPLVLERIRQACDGPLLLMKGPELAAYYPAPELRSFWDVDLLVTDAARVHRELLAAGFYAVGDPGLYVDIHHLRPLEVSGLPLAVEIHSRPKWVDGFEPPTASELFHAAVPAAVGVEGINALPPEHHALLIAAHAWAHEPLRRVSDLVDIAVLRASADEAELQALAEHWGIGKLWRTTSRACDAVLQEEPLPLILRPWASNLVDARERTVVEDHLRRWLSGFALLPARTAVRQLGGVLADELRPDENESWRAKMARMGRATTNAFTRLSQHRSGRPPSAGLARRETR